MDKNGIIEAVCSVCGVNPADLTRRDRTEPLPTARALIAHFMYRELRMMPREILPHIGPRDGGRTAVYHYLGRSTLVERRSPWQKQLREKAERVQTLINQD